MATTGTGFSFSTPATTTLTTTTAQGISFSMTNTTGTPVTTSTSTGDGGTVPAAPPGGSDLTGMSYRQLEDIINQWILEMEEQEKLFHNQAKQVNAWDSLLIKNSDQISELSDAVERVKLDQQRLDQELDFIEGQQRELNEVLNPLEKALQTSNSNISANLNPMNADVHREVTYQLAETVDAQLNRMAEDLKEMIDHLNVTSQNKHDSKEPVNQICQILNAHMDCLQSIDDNTVLVQQRLDEVLKQSESIST